MHHCRSLDSGHWLTVTKLQVVLYIPVPHISISTLMANPLSRPLELPAEHAYHLSYFNLLVGRSVKHKKQQKVA